jgi:hypothetical protein
MSPEVARLRHGKIADELPFFGGRAVVQRTSPQ